MEPHFLVLHFIPYVQDEIWVNNWTQTAVIASYSAETLYKQNIQAVEAFI